MELQDASAEVSYAQLGAKSSVPGRSRVAYFTCWGATGTPIATGTCGLFKRMIPHPNQDADLRHRVPIEPPRGEDGDTAKLQLGQGSRRAGFFHTSGR